MHSGYAPTLFGVPRGVAKFSGAVG